MNPMGEIDELRQPVDATPDNRAAGGEGIAQPGHPGFIRRRNLVTIHADSCRGHGGVAGKRCRRVTVAAIDAHPSGVKLMRVIDRLFGGVTRRATHGLRNKGGHQGGQDCDESNDRKVNLNVIVNTVPLQPHTLLPGVPGSANFTI